MSTTNVTIAVSDALLERVSGVVMELRTAYGKNELVQQIKAPRARGYRIAYLESDGEVPCVAGFVIGMKLASGPHLYVDDLVTSERHRFRGAGARMIQWLKSYALEHRCEQLHLDSGVQRFAAHRFCL